MIVSQNSGEQVLFIGKGETRLAASKSDSVEFGVVRESVVKTVLVVVVA